MAVVRDQEFRGYWSRPVLLCSWGSLRRDGERPEAGRPDTYLMYISTMENDVDTTTVPVSTLLSACPQVRVGLALSAPISQRVDALVKSAALAGELTNRRELISAAILALQDDPDSLVRLIRSLRVASAGEAVLPPAVGDVVVVPRQSPGPRRRQA